MKVTVVRVMVSSPGVVRVIAIVVWVGNISWTMKKSSSNCVSNSGVNDV